jgi:hypothetical protein
MHAGNVWEDMHSFGLISKHINMQVYETIIIQFAVCGYDTLCLLLREEYILELFTVRVLRRIFGSDRRL